MNRRLHLWDEAELDVVEAGAWYEEQRDGLGSAFLMEVDVVMSRVSQTPLQFPEIKDGVREHCFIEATAKTPLEPTAEKRGGSA